MPVPVNVARKGGGRSPLLFFFLRPVSGWAFGALPAVQKPGTLAFTKQAQKEGEKEAILYVSLSNGVPIRTKTGLAFLRAPGSRTEI